MILLYEVMHITAPTGTGSAPKPGLSPTLLISLSIQNKLLGRIQTCWIKPKMLSVLFFFSFAYLELPAQALWFCGCWWWCFFLFCSGDLEGTLAFSCERHVTHTLLQEPNDNMKLDFLTLSKLFTYFLFLILQCLQLFLWPLDLKMDLHILLLTINWVFRGCI